MTVASLLSPIHIPDWAWKRPETREHLCGRDIGALFRLAQRCGASQARIAAASGLAQARVSEIINGRRGVTDLAVYERIADGLHMPDDARMMMGLAPRQPDDAPINALSGEIGRVHPNQAPVAAEIRRRAGLAAELDVLAVRALGILGMNDSLLRPALLGRDAPLKLRVLLVDPESTAAAARAGEIGESVESFTAGVHLALGRLREMAAANSALHVEVALYSRLPIWRIIRLDSVLYVSAFTADWEGHESVVYEIPATPTGAFWAGFRRQFDDLWANATLTIGG